MSAAASELVDVVDADDRVVGQVTRAALRAGRLRHRATYLLVFNRRGELFVHLRSADKDVFASHWDVAVGGVVGAGESYDDGARRELAEEVGIVGAVIEPLFAVAFDDPACPVLGRAYRVAWDGPLVLQAEEIVRGEWLTPAQVEARLTGDRFCPDGAAVWRRYRVRSVS